MFAYQTCSELIIGCKSFHPLIRLVREKHFKKIVIIYEQTHHGIVPAGVRRLVRQLESKTNQCILAPVDIRLELVKLDTAVDLVISYGTRHVHDIAKRSNVFGATIYCIETTPGHMSSYGTGIV
jgi:glycerol dehydrogenase-like iron-containing ADH family enzyme